MLIKPKLTEKEEEVMSCLLDGYCCKEIAVELNIETRTVKEHLVNMRRKLNAKSSLHMVAIWLGRIIEDLEEL